MPGPEFHDADENLELSALRELVETILLTDYRDRNGVRLFNSVAFLNAQAVLERRDALGNARRD